MSTNPKTFYFLGLRLIFKATGHQKLIILRFLCGISCFGSLRLLSMTLSESRMGHFTQSLLHAQEIWSQVLFAEPKQSKLPSLRWIVLIRSLFESLQVSLIPKLFAFFSTSDSLIFKYTSPFLPYTLRLSNYIMLPYPRAY